MNAHVTITKAHAIQGCRLFAVYSLWRTGAAGSELASRCGTLPAKLSQSDRHLGWRMRCLINSLAQKHMLRCSIILTLRPLRTH